MQQPIYPMVPLENPGEPQGGNLFQFPPPIPDPVEENAHEPEAAPDGQQGPQQEGLGQEEEHRQDEEHHQEAHLDEPVRHDEQDPEAQGHQVHRRGNQEGSGSSDEEGPNERLRERIRQMT